MRHAANDDFRRAAPVLERAFSARAPGEAGQIVHAPSFEAAAVAYLEAACAALDGELTVIVTEVETGLEQAFDLTLSDA